VTLADVASWATILAVPLTALGIAATLTSGGAQRARRQQFREWLQAFKAECQKARSAINSGRDIPLMGENGIPQTPPKILDSLRDLQTFLGEIRFIRDTDIHQLFLASQNVIACWGLVQSQIFDESIETKFRDGASRADLRRRMRTEDMLLDAMDMTDKLINEMLTCLRKLDRHNVVGAWRV
jgi:hypothetical protein